MPAGCWQWYHKGFALHALLTATARIGLNMTCTPRMRKLRHRGGKALAEGVRHRAELTSRGPNGTPAPGLLHELARTGSWGWQLSGKLILDVGFIS